MALTNEQLLVQIKADTADLKKGLADAKSQISGLGRDAKGAGNVLGSAFTDMTGILKKFAGPAALGLVAKQMADFTIESMRAADAIGETASSLNLGVEAYQEMSFAAAQSGVSVDKFGMSMRKMNDLIGSALNGDKSAVAYFDTLGIKIEDLKKMDAEAAFAAITSAIGKVGNAQQQSALSAQAFGAKNTEMLNVIRGGSDAFNAAREDAHKYGAVLSEELVAAAGETIDKFDAMQTALGTNMKTLFINVFKPAVDLATTLMGGLNAKFAEFNRRVAETKMLGDSDLVIEQRDLDKFLEVNKKSIEVDRQLVLRPGAISEQAYNAAVARVNKYEALLKRYNEVSEELRKRTGGGDRQATRTLPPINEPKVEAAASAATGTKTSAAKEPKPFERTNPMAEGLESLKEFKVEIAEFDPASIGAAPEFAELAWKNSLDKILNYNESATSRLLAQWQDTTTELDFAMMGWIGQSAEALTNFVMTGKLDFKELANSIIRDLIRIQMQELLVKAFSMIAGAWAGGGAAALGGTGTSGVAFNSGDAWASFGASAGFTPPRAGGGHVNKNQMYMVGERGPEMFVPPSVGKIVPGYAMNQNPGSVRVEVINKGTPQQAQSSDVRFDAKGMVVSIITDDIRRNGPISNTMGQAFGMRRTM